MILYIQINKNTSQVTGYSSTRMHEDDLIVDSNKLNDKFLNMPIFFNYIQEKEMLIFDDNRYKEYMDKKQEVELTNEQKLGQKISDLEIQIMMLQKLLEAKGDA